MFELFGKTYSYEEIYSVEAFAGLNRSVEFQIIGDYEESDGAYLDAAYYEITLNSGGTLKFTMDVWTMFNNDEDMVYEMFQPM